MLKLVCLLIWALCGPWASATTIPASLRIPDPQLLEPPAVAEFYPALLRLALEKANAGKAPPALRTVGQAGMGRERFRVLLAQGEVDVLWSSSTPEREAQFEAVRVNLLKGVNGYRVLLVPRRDLPRFAGVRDLPSLQSFSVGSGLHWSDTQILRDRGFRVVTAPQLDSLLKMLSLGRFDFMLRNVVEVDGELAGFPELELAAEPRLLLHYRQPIYFFVAKGNKALAQRIHDGLKLAMADGSFDRLFMQNPALKKAWNLTRSPQRTILHLSDS
jgi:hypothetical protein